MKKIVKKKNFEEENSKLETQEEREKNLQK